MVVGMCGLVFEFEGKSQDGSGLTVPSTLNNIISVLFGYEVRRNVSFEIVPIQQFRVNQDSARSNYYLYKYN